MAKRKFKEWLDAQPIGTEFTSMDMYIMFKNMSYAFPSVVSAAFVIKEFSNVSIDRREYNGRSMANIYKKVSE